MCERGELRAVQHLVRVRVADTAEQARIGDRALERAVLALHSISELSETGPEDVESAGIHRGERGLALDQMERGAALGSGLGEHQRAASEFEGGERYPARHLRMCAEPAQPAGDH